VNPLFPFPGVRKNLEEQIRQKIERNMISPDTSDKGEERKNNRPYSLRQCGIQRERHYGETKVACVPTTVQYLEIGAQGDLALNIFFF
jgi:hypothetical protein